jgi:hypothetical protein
MGRDSGQTDPGREQPGWWQLVEDHLTALEREGETRDDAAAPWSDASTGAPALTAEQRAFLAGDDQPGVPRIAPPDHRRNDQPPVPRFGVSEAGSTSGSAPGSTTGNIPGDTPESLS